MLDESPETDNDERTISPDELFWLERIFNAPLFDDEDLTGLADYDE